MSTKSVIGTKTPAEIRADELRKLNDVLDQKRRQNTEVPASPDKSDQVDP
jgi:hypothetical protein